MKGKRKNVIRQKRESGGSGSQRRSGRDRRIRKDRRIGEERRKSEPWQRLRFGFWKSLAYGEPLLKEASKYQYFRNESGEEGEASSVLYESFDAVFNGRRDDLFVEAKSAIEAIAEYVADSYEVRMIERRSGLDRRSGNE